MLNYERSWIIVLVITDIVVQGHIWEGNYLFLYVGGTNILISLIAYVRIIHTLLLWYGLLVKGHDFHPFLLRGVSIGWILCEDPLLEGIIKVPALPAAWLVLNELALYCYK